MVEIAAATPSGAAPRKSLVARVIGVVMSPRETYADIVAAPRWVGAMLFVMVVSSLALGVFLSTERGQNLSLDQQVTGMESFGMTVSDQMYEQMEARKGRAVYFGVGGQLIFIPIVTLIVAGLAIGLFNVLLGGDATFRQVFAVATHTNVIGTLALLFILPLNYVREAMSSPTNLSVFLPMLDEASFAVRFLGAIDLFRIWGIVNLAIGLAVLYNRRTSPIAWSLLAVYAVIALTIAAVMTAVSGA
jgi:hypothetical protein